MKILAHRHSTQGLITYYISLYGFVGSSVAISLSTDAWKLAGFGLTLIATLVQDIDWYRRSSAHPHDLALLERITAFVNEQALDKFFAEHDFLQQSYSNREKEVLWTLREDWVGVENTLIDPKLQATWSELRNLCDQLLDLMEDKVAFAGANFYLLVPPKDSRATEVNLQQMEANAEEANRLARDILEKYESLRAGHRRLQRQAGGI